MKSLRDLFLRLPHDGKARQILRSFNLGMMRPGKVQSVKELAEALGIDVHQVDLPARMGGRLVSDPFTESGYAIEVNRAHSVVSRRFTVLHEIGHFLLHVNHKDPLFDGLNLNRGDDEFYFELSQEQEANAVADVLLFGDGALEAASSLHGGDRVKLAKYFGVSVAMIEVAMKKFGVK
ncbi:ImmA/IrrE family metallo-endopeptidase [Salipiger abyssi]|uniref:ImmA/IrrE family metallo-endopeptidase n=1 Tax=Salipiger abyssi TaxID=1250539 RepID=UPI000976189E|nr:ImmA/IrrE family metallo-endopeptidase [Salipiger abyssi]